MLIAILIILLFASLVLIHEWGHFIMARRNGVGAEEFGFGFPPRVWGKKVHGTVYSINLLPLGGFVRMKGEDTGDTRPGTFGGASIGAKTKILLAGVVMNLVSAFLILYVLCLTGLPGLGSPFEPTFLHPNYAQPKRLILTEVEAGSPAAKAGLVRGDYVLAGDGKTLTTETDLQNFTKDHAGKSVVLTVNAQGDERNVTLTLRPPSATTGYLGVVGQQVYKLRYDPLSALAAAAYITAALFVATIWGVIMLIINIPALLVGLFSSSVPAAAQNAAGPLGIIFIFKSISALGFAYIFLFMANIGVALAAFNVLPLPALDGGRLALVWWQGVTKRRINPDTEARIHTYGFMALIGLMLVISVYDLRKYF